MLDWTIFTKLKNKLIGLKRVVKDDRKWRESFKSYENGKLKSITYYCEKTKEFKTEFATQEHEVKKNGLNLKLDKNWVEREKFAKDLLQPFKADGTVNPDYVKTYKTDPRVDHAHRSYARNANNRGFAQNMGVDAEMRAYEKKKYGL